MGVISSNTTLIQEAYDQCRLYRQYLRDPASHLWAHIVLGPWTDSSLWGTGQPPLHSDLTTVLNGSGWSGNAWAAAGMTRVLATILHSPFSTAFASEAVDLAAWINEILTASFLHIDVSYLPVCVSRVSASVLTPSSRRP